LEVTPQLYVYTTDLLVGEVWKRPDLVPRDRSLVAIGQTAQMAGHIKLARDNGVKPGEITGLITHQAFYSGWPNAMSAVGVTKQVSGWDFLFLRLATLYVFWTVQWR
jgi:4-carboxymuconolactone decarboxylase